MLVEAGSRCIDQDLVVWRIEADHARWSAGIRRVVGIQLVSGMGEEVSRHCCMIVGPEAEGAWEGGSVVLMWIGIVFLLQSITLPLSSR